ncbi:MAG TPA: nucleotidyltransferase family protein [Burkholderiales bacterium]|nr:nucleotidyltransferase family protein [Burkholderiales bacterium]
MRRYRVRRRAGGLRPATGWKPVRALEEVKAKKDLIRTLARAHGAIAVFLFGSAARGDDEPGSDLDFMVDMDRGRSILDLIGLADDLELAFGRKVDLGTRSALKPAVRPSAERDAIRIV